MPISVVVCVLNGRARHSLDKNVHTIETNTDALLVASREFGLEQNAEKSQYMVMSCEQDAGGPHHIQTAKYFENMVKC